MAERVTLPGGPTIEVEPGQRWEAGGWSTGTPRYTYVDVHREPDSWWDRVLIQLCLRGTLVKRYEF